MKKIEYYGTLYLCGKVYRCITFRHVYCIFVHFIDVIAKARNIYLLWRRLVSTLS